ncbi:MAG: hypothetical protein IPM57_06175 [Oligoflexia bacterium]|nr:hypothetical protein [Oligoflexia bacterium]
MFKKSLDLWPKVFMRVLPWAFIHLLIQTFLTIAQQFIPQKESLFMLSWILFVFGVTLFFSVVGVIVINQATHDIITLKKTPLLKSLEDNFKYVMIESFRAFLPVMLKTLLLVIPGIIETVRLYWITYVVQFDEKYKQGQVDALEQSRKLVKGSFIKTALILIFVGFLSMLPRFGSSSSTNVFLLSFIIFISVGLEVFGDIILYHFYWSLREKNVTKIQK